MIRLLSFIVCEEATVEVDGRFSLKRVLQYRGPVPANPCVYFEIADLEEELTFFSLNIIGPNKQAIVERFAGMIKRIDPIGVGLVKIEGAELKSGRHEFLLQIADEYFDRVFLWE